VLEIAPLAEAALNANLDHAAITTANALIFVSANAVEHGMPAIRARGGFTSAQQVYAIGEATANALRQGGIANVVSPSLGNDSEALLALTPLQSAVGQTMVVVKGESEAGGRTLLQTTLATRGAKVDLLICYTRRAVRPPVEAESALMAVKDVNKSVKVFSVLSVETLVSLNAHFAINDREDLRGSGIMVVPHERIAVAARATGWAEVHVVPMAAEAMCDALQMLKPQIVASSVLPSDPSK
jgi:uroporphyrinogen-III synthase